MYKHHFGATKTLYTCEIYHQGQYTNNYIDDTYVIRPYDLTKNGPSGQIFFSKKIKICIKICTYGEINNNRG